MSKGKNRSKQRRQSHRQREYKNPITKRERLLSDFYFNNDSLTDIEDRRRWSPTPVRLTALQFQKQLERIAPSSVPARRDLYDNLTTLPNIHEVMVCVRRKMRREVLHALKLNGKGGSGKRRRTPDSNIHC